MIAGPLDLLTAPLKPLGETKWTTLEPHFRNWSGGFQGIYTIEGEIQARITASIAEDQRTQELAAAHEQLVASHLEKFSFTSSG